MEKQEILFLEELQTNAFPALQTVMYDGWSVRFGGGFTYRVNDANPMYPEVLPAEEKIDHVEALYRASGLGMAIFKLHEGMDPERLRACTELLDRRGYGTERDGNIYLCSLGDFSRTPGVTVQIDTEMTEDWLDAFLTMNGTGEAQKPAAKTMLRNIACPIAAASVRENGVMAACGLGVLERRYVGLYDIFVDPRLRRRGLGGDVCTAIMNYGREQGCRTAYLQCLSDNHGAIAMYDGLGFERTYEYWFRTKRF